MYASIVVPLDGSAFGKRALPTALAVARRGGAAVRLVHVHEPIVYPRGWSKFDTPLHSEMREEMRAELTALAAQLSWDTALPVVAEFLDGPVVPTLQRYLAERRPDLVVIRRPAPSPAARTSSASATRHWRT